MIKDSKQEGGNIPEKREGKAQANTLVHLHSGACLCLPTETGDKGPGAIKFIRDIAPRIRGIIQENIEVNCN